MAAASSPASAVSPQAVRSSTSPSISVPRPSVLLDGKHPEHLLHGGDGSAADSGSGGGKMRTDGVGMVRGQDGGDAQLGRDGDEKQQQCKKVGEQKQNHILGKIKDTSVVPNISKVPQVQVGEGKHHMKNEPPKPGSRKRRNNKVPIGSKSPRSPIQAASSPGVNMLARVAALKKSGYKGVKMESPSLKDLSPDTRRAKMEGSHEKSQQSPSCTMVSPPLEDLSPDTRTTNSQGPRKRRKLTSAIWKEAVPIYRGERLVQGRCAHCRQVFASTRDSGTSSLNQHLKVCEAKTGRQEMVEKMGHPEGVNVTSQRLGTNEG